MTENREQRKDRQIDRQTDRGRAGESDVGSDERKRGHEEVKDGGILPWLDGALPCLYTLFPFSPHPPHWSILNRPNL